MFLHQRHVLARAQARTAAPSAAASGNRDIGDVAVIEDSGGVIGRRNPFNLDRRTVILQPTGAGYQIRTATGSFDAAASQNSVPLAGLQDDDTRLSALPFAFTFFGARYQQVWINSNGTLSFGSGDTDYTGSYGHFISAPPTIAPLFTDLDPSQSSEGVRVLAEPGRFIVTWSNVPLAGSAGFSVPPLETFQVRLYPEGRIEFAYNSTNPPNALVGITPGNTAAVSLVDFASVPSGTFSGVAETFAASDQVDVVTAAQRFYQTHEDAYDYLIFYNAEGVAAGNGVVAYEMTTRSHGAGYGDIDTEIGAEFGSPRRLQAVLNLGPVSQYPVDPNGFVPARFPSGDTPLSILGHEAGHLYLALVSVPDQSHGTPMLGRAQVHWAFTFNSDASFLEGNRIADNGALASPRFGTTATVQHYSALDQYLMGFRAPEEVPSTFAVLNSGQSLTRAPQTGVNFFGDRLDIGIDDIIRAAGRRTPDSTVAQRRFRFAFVVIVPAGVDLDNSSAGAAVRQVEQYRSLFENFFASATDRRAVADTSVRHSVTLSLAPGAGVITGQKGLASITLAHPAAAPLTFALNAPQGVIAAPVSVTIPAGGTRVAFQISGLHDGVEEFSAAPSDSSYETVFARVQSGPSPTLEVVRTSPGSVVLRAVDSNELPYSNVPIAVIAPAGISPSTATTDEYGLVTFRIPTDISGTLSLAVGGNTFSFNVPAAPTISAVVNGASYQPTIAPGSLATVFGANFSKDAQVLVNGFPVALLYVSAAQINFLAPDNLLAGAAQLAVLNTVGTSMVSAQVQRYAPGIFFDTATGNGAIRVIGDALEIYCTGLGAADQPVTVQIAGNNARVLYAGASSISGVNQVNVQIPPGLPAGTHPLSLSINGASSNTVQLVLASGR